MLRVVWEPLCAETHHASVRGVSKHTPDPLLNVYLLRVPRPFSYRGHRAIGTIAVSIATSAVTVESGHLRAEFIEDRPLS